MIDLLAAWLAVDKQADDGEKCENNECLLYSAAKRKFAEKIND